ncbi:ATP synthase F1 subunit delta [Oecophyllibacter saccharovorans]|uniref:ATP synthase F1 subunit delta n=1 Tax=Oecophyllibacter saccharovorans TaxID=2558360 RepID=UPI00116EBD64|nr:ATP synthase F1 subunit delta [Oecophyllibacter saccharovorans]TPW36273.1 ATP synthase F1 subunit delta [Oecophyllibacter saccharovorans]
MTSTQEKQIRAPGELAQRYGRAFCAYLQSTHGGAHERNHVLKSVRALQEALVADPKLRTFLDNPRLTGQSPQKVASMLAEGLGLGNDLRRLIGVVAREGRLPILGEILEAILLEEARDRGEVTVEVRTARRLTDHQRDQLRHRLREAGHHHISMTEHVDPALIGGMTVRVGPVLFDTSIAGRLTRLQHAMKGAA